MPLFHPRAFWKYKMLESFSHGLRRTCSDMTTSQTSCDIGDTNTGIADICQVYTPWNPNPHCYAAMPWRRNVLCNSFLFCYQISISDLRKNTLVYKTVTLFCRRSRLGDGVIFKLMKYYHDKSLAALEHLFFNQGYLSNCRL